MGSVVLLFTISHSVLQIFYVMVAIDLRVRMPKFSTRNNDLP
jgi:hypothetical protein